MQRDARYGIFQKVPKLWMSVRIHVGNIDNNPENLKPRMIGVDTQKRILSLCRYMERKQAPYYFESLKKCWKEFSLLMVEETYFLVL